MTITKKTFMFLTMALLAITGKAMQVTDSLWNREFTCAQEIVDTYTTVKKGTKKKNQEQHILNMCHYIWQSGEYMFKCRGKNEDITTLPKHVAEIDLDNEVVAKFMLEHKVARFTDHYFTLLAMKRGCSFEESRDGVEITVFFPIRGLNANDYLKLNKVFSCKNSELHTAYLKRMTHLLTNNGCNNELLEIRTLIERNTADSKLKQKIIALYDMYATIMPGMQAPDVKFKDAEGNSYSIGDFKGKVTVIDVWATWCSSCLKNMPQFMELKKEFEGNNEVAFFTVSTDDDELKERWIAAIKKHNMGSMLNLLPDRSAVEQFENAYFVSSVPRYIVIDKEGRIVSAFAPKPGEEMQQMITDSL